MILPYNQKKLIIAPSCTTKKKKAGLPCPLSPSSLWKWHLVWESFLKPFTVVVLPSYPRHCVHFSLSIFLPPWTELKYNWSPSSIWHTEAPHQMLMAGDQPLARLESQWGWMWLRSVTATLACRRRRPDTTDACGPQIQFEELSS